MRSTRFHRPFPLRPLQTFTSIRLSLAILLEPDGLDLIKNLLAQVRGKVMHQFRNKMPGEDI
jgi:hypothetical protein